MHDGFRRLYDELIDGVSWQLLQNLDLDHDGRRLAALVTSERLSLAGSFAASTGTAMFVDCAPVVITQMTPVFLPAAIPRSQPIPKVY